MVALAVLIGLFVLLLAWFLPLVVAVRYRHSGRDHFFDLRLRLGGLPWDWGRRWSIPGAAGILRRFVDGRKAPQERPGRRRPARLWSRLRLRDYVRAARILSSRARWRRVRLFVGYGAGDPARTAVRVGTLWSLLGAAAALVFPPSARVGGVQLNVRPLYDRVGGDVDASCIFTLRLGDIIRAGYSLFAAKEGKGCGNTLSRG